MISDTELYILSYYRASELAGSVLFGRLALHTTVDEIRVPLTRHCCEEAEHAWLWTRTIRDLGHVPVKITHTYQTEYAREFGMPRNTLEVFCLTQVLEKRALGHYRHHLGLPDTHPLIRETLQKMIDDEQGHISWIRVELDKYEAGYGSGEVRRVMSELEEIDRRAAERLLSQSPYKEFFRA